MDKIFVDGLIFKRPRTGAPEFVKGNVSMKVAELKAFLDKHNNGGWVNATLKESKGGKLYFELDTWTPNSTLTDDEKARIQALKAGEATKKEVENTIKPDDIPFS